MSIFGDFERTFADLYPYRWAFAAGLIVLIAVSAAAAYRMGWHRFLWSHRVPAGIIAVPALVVVVWGGWTLGSPLFTNTTLLMNALGKEMGMLPRSPKLPLTGSR